MSTTFESEVIRHQETAQSGLSQNLGMPDVNLGHDVKINLSGRILMNHGQERACEVVEMSPKQATILAAVNATPGESAIIYVEHIGRVSGNVSRCIQNGLIMSLNTSAYKREKLAGQLNWLMNRAALGLPDDRRHTRVETSKETMLSLPDGRKYPCKIVDVSLSGAATQIDIRPAIGTSVILGKTRAKIVRHLSDGIAVQFSTTLSPETVHEGNMRDL